MTERETKDAKERVDMIVKKVRDLIVLEDQVLEAREAVHQSTAMRDKAPTTDLQEDTLAERQKVLVKLESELKACIVELRRITDELKWAIPCFRAYVLPQMSELVRTLKATDETERCEFPQLVSALMDEGDPRSPEQLEEAIIARLKDNLERVFRIK